jgi:hypothetical protein
MVGGGKGGWEVVKLKGSERLFSIMLKCEKIL